MTVSAFVIYTYTLCMYSIYLLIDIIFFNVSKNTLFSVYVNIYIHI